MNGLRDYQLVDIERIIAALKAHKSTVYVAPTGSGKTVVLAEIARGIHSRGYRTMMLVHRRELVDQAVGTLKQAMPGITVGVEAAGWPSIPWADLHVGMVQSIVRRQVVTPPHLIAIDEAHHARAATWEKVLARWPGARRLGLTATPQRLDGKGLRPHFASMVMAPTPADLIAAGWLAPVRTLSIPLVDPTAFRVSKATGDYRQEDIESAVTDKVIADSAAAYLEYAAGKRAIFFGVNIAHSESVAAKLRELGVAAEHVDGTDHSSRRDHVMGLFRDGALDVLCNVGLVCLDRKTEILTREGWRGMEDYADEPVANWHPDGTITFGPARGVIRRPLQPDEMMISYESRIGFRVTSNHRMVWADHRSKREWTVREAGSLIGSRGFVPVSGQAPPEDLKAPNPDPAAQASRAARIRANSYILRRSGWGAEEARTEAARRIDHRDGLRYRDPKDLTLDECRLIGFWIGDGSVTRLANGGLEYSLCQSTRYPMIIDWVEGVLLQCGIDHRRRSHPYGPKGHEMVKWSLPRGTGFGSQARRGVFHLEPYLSKDGSDLFWGLSRDQFVALLEGLDQADGCHNREPTHSMVISNTSVELMELLQAIAVCRGLRATLRVKDQGSSTYRSTRPIWSLAVISADRMEIGAGRRGVEPEKKHRSEYVWCVNNDSTFLITRREGRVMVMGNSEGFDVPECECTILGRSTKSTTLFLQAAGRSMRPGPGKTALVLDLGGSAYELGTADETREWSLDDGEVDTEERERKRVCPNCHSVLTGPPPCPWCGWVPTGVQQKQWKEQQLKLVEIKARKKKPGRPKPRLTRGELRSRLRACHRSDDFESAVRELAEEVGYKAGWADYIIDLKNDAKGGA